tara:strand:- start:2281 stop:2799 length:519 start_codon:yes stop_codon:yes gene_type:complete
MTQQTPVQAMLAAAPTVPPPFRGAMLRRESDLPFVDLGDGSEMQVLQVDLAQGLWIVKMRFHPGCEIARHYHTGPVYAVTLSGRWHYQEYAEEINEPGSFLFEPAGSVHTLQTLPGSTEPAEVWFAVFGANVNIDEVGDVISIVDAATVLKTYQLLCADQGKNADGVIVFGD